jgi:hypothetical protein
MSTDQPNVGPIPQPDGASGPLAELKAQCERLQQVVLALEQEKKRDAEALAAAQAELKEYRHYLCDLAGLQVHEEDWQDFREEEYTIPIDEVIAELECSEGS